MQASRNLGVPTTRVKIMLFIYTAIVSMAGGHDPGHELRRCRCIAGTYREFYAIVAVVIGRDPDNGRLRFRIGAALGALIFGMVQQGIIFAGIDADWFQFVLGGMLLGAVLINRFVRSRAVLVR